MIDLNLRLLVSTIPPGHGGAGDYLQTVIKRYNSHIIITPKFWSLFGVKNKYLRRIVYAVEILTIKSLLEIISRIFEIKSLVLYHPQTLGYALSKRLINKSNFVDFWVVDASFFCKKSYNVLNGRECLRCISTYNPDITCDHFPRRQLDSDYIEFIKTLRENKKNIRYIVQTSGYVDLVSKSINPENIIISKMIFDEFKSIEKYKFQSSKMLYGIAYHANPIEAKGYEYTHRLASKLPDVSFIFPNRPIPCNLPLKINCSYKPCTWNDGLKNILSASSIVICPSLWSAPVEASVIKTMLLKKPVAIIKNKYSFSSNLPSEVFIELTGNENMDSLHLRSLLNAPEKLKVIAENGYKWAREYIDE
jgi:hypothetical protein